MNDHLHVFLCIPVCALVLISAYWSKLQIPSTVWIKPFLAPYLSLFLPSIHSSFPLPPIFLSFFLPSFLSFLLSFFPPFFISFLLSLFLSSFLSFFSLNYQKIHEWIRTSHACRHNQHTRGLCDHKCRPTDRPRGSLIIN